MSSSGRPLPKIEPTNERFWASVRNHRMELPQCTECRRFHWPARDRCPHCLAIRLDWVSVAGTGFIYSYVVFHQLYHTAFEDMLPYNVAIIELDEGPRLISSLVEPKEAIGIGKRVRIQYEDLDAHVGLHHFRIVDE
ncbi:MAG: hypothetical protein A3G24_12725 [Betaproteobacteria bacterium RIFCSPLOWO2_12_FULL_62_13]|nr:MAG: hypothetical protein A3G24_12725 [Betaproteobacteria bacterium RIFCSPLOWO2_12_FULL_62_13]